EILRIPNPRFCAKGYYTTTRNDGDGATLTKLKKNNARQRSDVRRTTFGRWSDADKFTATHSKKVKKKLEEARE
uniref:Uncharacterized protein n=1 Tax=Cucumis melo TaxID=3656 RepID=A0A9I9EBG6_CUCME